MSTDTSANPEQSQETKDPPYPGAHTLGNTKVFASADQIRAETTVTRESVKWLAGALAGAGVSIGLGLNLADFNALGDCGETRQSFFALLPISPLRMGSGLRSRALLCPPRRI